MALWYNNSSKKKNILTCIHIFNQHTFNKARVYSTETHLFIAKLSISQTYLLEKPRGGAATPRDPMRKLSHRKWESHSERRFWADSLQTSPRLLEQYSTHSSVYACYWLFTRANKQRKAESKGKQGSLAQYGIG